MLLAVIVPVDVKLTTSNVPEIVRFARLTVPVNVALLAFNWFVIVEFVLSTLVALISSSRSSCKIRFKEPLPVIDFDIVLLV